MARTPRQKTTAQPAVQEETVTQEVTPEVAADPVDTQPKAAEEPIATQPEVAKEPISHGSSLLNELVGRRELASPIPQILISIDNILADYVENMKSGVPQTNDTLFRYTNELTRVLVMATNHQDAPIGLIAMELICDYFRAYRHNVFSAELLFRTSNKTSRISPAYNMYAHLCLYFEACAKVENRRDVTKILTVHKLLEAMTTEVQRSRLASFIA